MPTAQFQAALPFILRWEGGYVNHPNDRGGATNRGVTQKVYDGWRGRQGLPARSVKAIEESEVAAIYEGDYWLPPRCDRLQQQLDLVQFDTAVNMGVRRAVQMLQKAVNCPADGSYGPATEQAVATCDLGTAITAYCKVRETFYHTLAERNPTQKVFLKGWMNRLNALRKEVGLPGYEAAVRVDFGDTDYMQRIPDIGAEPGFDF